MKYVVVTVAHREDFGLLRLQARSMRLHLACDLADEIVIVENPAPGRPTAWRDRLRREYGDAASLVRFIDAREIAHIPDTTSGWLSQQILKLMVSRVLAADRYLVLDAKNHLVFPLTRSALEAGGKLRSRLISFEQHPIRTMFENAVRYFGLAPEDHVQAFLPATTPYGLPTRVVRELVVDLAERENRPFPLVFLGIGTTEFLLFGAFITAGHRVEELYDLSAVQYATVWEEIAARGTGEVGKLIAETEEGVLPFFAVHRRALPKLKDNDCLSIAAFWQRRGLFPSISDGVRFLRDPNADD
jgi:hypothetical protein